MSTAEPVTALFALLLSIKADGDPPGDDGVSGEGDVEGGAVDGVGGVKGCGCTGGIVGGTVGERVEGRSV